MQSFVCGGDPADTEEASVVLGESGNAGHVAYVGDVDDEVESAVVEKLWDGHGATVETLVEYV